MLDDLIPVMRALESGDKAQARRLLRPMLENPTADLWYLASQACEKQAQEIVCLERALALDPMHGQARNRLLALRQNQQQTPPPASPPTAPARPESKPRRFTQKPLPGEPPVPVSTAAPVPMKPALTEVDLPPLKKVGSQRNRSGWRWVGCFSMILLSLASSYFVLWILGSGLPGQFRALVTGSQPPIISDRDDAVYVIAPSQSQQLRRNETSSDVLEPGYAHQLVFEAQRGEDIAVALQFFSPAAQGVRRNVAIFDPNGEDARDRCMRDTLFGGDNGVAFICTIDLSGTWSLRVYGRESESTGAYFASVRLF